MPLCSVSLNCFVRPVSQGSQGFGNWGDMAGEGDDWRDGCKGGGQPENLIRDGVGLEVGVWGRTRRMQSHFGTGSDTRGPARPRANMMRTGIRAGVLGRRKVPLEDVASG